MTQTQTTKAPLNESFDILVQEFKYIELRLSDLKKERALTKFEEILLDRVQKIQDWATDKQQ